MLLFSGDILLVKASCIIWLLPMCRVYQLSGSCLSFLMFSDRRSPLEFHWLLYNRTRRPSRGPASPILEEILRSLRHWMVHYKSPQTAPVPRSGLPPIIQSSVARSGQVSADCISHQTPGQVRSPETVPQWRWQWKQTQNLSYFPFSFLRYIVTREIDGTITNIKDWVWPNLQYGQGSLQILGHQTQGLLFLI